DEAAAGEVGDVRRRRQPAHRLGGVGELAALDALVAGALHPRYRRSHAVGVALEEDDLAAGEEESVDDAGAHDAATDDAGAGGDGVGHARPPEASMTSPVIQRASSETSSETTPAMSSGVPRRRIALLEDIASIALSAVIERMYSVSVAPGRTT